MHIKSMAFRLNGETALSDPLPLRLFEHQYRALKHLSKRRGMAQQVIVRRMIEHCLKHLVQG